MKALIEEIQRDIIEGRGALAREKMLSVAAKPVPRPYAADSAKLARRVGFFDLSLRILNHIVRPGPRNPVSPSDFEKAEYAASLAALGAESEALDLLKEVNVAKVPDALLFQSYVLFSRWEYEEAVPLLKRYLVLMKDDPYQSVVGKVNLAACLVDLRRDREAKELLSELRDLTGAKHLTRLHGNVLELSGQLEILQGKIGDGEKHLATAEENLSSTGGVEALYIQKWKAIAKALRKNRDTESLVEVRAKAIELENWETVRECDLFLGVATKCIPTLLRVYFGSRQENYRQRLFQLCPIEFSAPATYLWEVKPGKGAKCALDLTVEIGRSNPLVPGQLLHRLASVLCTDFYKPFTIAQIHSELFKNDYFNPQSSPLRVHQAITRLRQWFRKTKRPLDVLHANSKYSLIGLSPASINVRSRMEVKHGKHSHQLEVLREHFANREFTAKEAGELLGTSPRTTLRVLKGGQESEELVRKGSGLRTQYRFAA